MIEDEGHYCVYYSDLECPVQRRLRDFSLIDSMESMKADDSARFAKTMKDVMTSSTFILQVLATFCASCPHLRRKTYETAEAGMSVKSSKVSPIRG